MVPSHESEALQDKQKLQMETFSELSECLFSTAFTCKNDFLRTSFYIQLSGMSSTFLFFFFNVYSGYRRASDRRCFRNG